MRTREGGQLRADLAARRALARRGSSSGLRRPRRRDAGRSRRGCTSACRSCAADVAVDRAAIAQEIVRMAARSDISEEIVRFRAHLAHWAALSDGRSPAAASWISCCRR